MAEAAMAKTTVTAATVTAATVTAATVTAATVTAATVGKAGCRQTDDARQCECRKGEKGSSDHVKVPLWRIEFEVPWGTSLIALYHIDFTSSSAESSRVAIEIQPRQAAARPPSRVPPPPRRFAYTPGRGHVRRVDLALTRLTWRA
jgi:hypothetical protein